MNFIKKIIGRKDIITPYRWGIIGPGAIATAFAKDLLLTSRATITSVLGRHQERTKIFAQKFATERSFTSLSDFLTEANFDAVYIATTHDSHFEYAKACLEQNIPTLVEKPMCINPHQTQELISISRKKNILLMEAMWSRFMPHIIESHRLVSNGTIGEINHLYSEFGFKAPYSPKSRLFDPSQGGSCILDIGIYPIFLSYLFNGMPTSIRARKIDAPTGVDESIDILFSYANRSTSVLSASFKNTYECRSEIFGTKAKITLPGRWHEGTKYIISTEAKSSQTKSFPRKFHGLKYEIDEFHLLLDENRSESSRWSLDDSLNLSKLMDQSLNQAKQ